MPLSDQPPPSGQASRDHLPLASQNIRGFDAWNSSSTGHQRAEARGPPGWRESRIEKLHSQFRAGHSGGERISDRVGAGSDDSDERHRMLIPKEVRARAMNSVADMLRNPGTMRPRSATAMRSCSPEKDETRSRPGSRLAVAGEDPFTQDLDEESGMVAPAERPPPLFMELVEERRWGGGEHAAPEATEQERRQQQQQQEQRKMFDGLVIYVNGSTHPLISDHKLKRLLAENGARTSIHLGRRQVTHVILGKPSGPTGGAGGGLAGGKLEKEIRRVGGCGVKYVGVEWVLESLKAGKRLPEARFANLKVAAKGQQSVLGVFSKKT